MPTVTVSSKNQITLPAEIVRELGLKAGDKLAVELIDGRIVALPEPESWADYFFGTAKGVYGETAEEIDRYIAEVRHGWEIDGLKNALSADDRLSAVYNATGTKARGLREIEAAAGLAPGEGIRYLGRLGELDAVKAVEPPENESQPYYRRTA